MRFTASWILLAASVCGQIVSFPSSYMDFLTSDPDTWHGLAPDIYSSCHVSVKNGPRYVTAWVKAGDHAFRATTNQGVIAVFKKSPPLGRVPHAGINTGFANVMHLDSAREQAWLPPGFLALLITGFSGTDTKFKLFIHNSALPLATGVLIDLPPTVVSGPGEVFVSASLIGSTLYVLEGVGLKVVRFLDSDMDLMPDLRDPLCEVALPYPQAGTGFIEAFLPHASLAAMTSTGHVSADVRYGIEDVPGGQCKFVSIQGPRALAAGPFPPRFRKCPSEGHDRVHITGSPSSSVIVEKASAQAGPWTTASTTPIVVTKKGLGYIGSLSTALVAGEYVRLTDTTHSLSSPPVTVCPPAPVVFSPNWNSLAGGPSSLVLEGDSLDGSVTAIFRPLGGRPSTAIPIATQSKHTLTLTIPSFSTATSGFIDVLKTGIGAGRASVFLVATP